MAVDIAIGVAHMISDMLIYIGGGFHHSYVQCTHFSRLHMCKTSQIMLIEPVFSVLNIMQKEF